MSNETEKEFLGRGWSFPVRLDEEGEVAMAVHEEDVAQAIRIILTTSLGERVMRYDFGSTIREGVFSPLNTTTLSLVQDRVERALVEWEPRIDLEEVAVTVDPREPSIGRLLIEIRYRVRVTNTFYNLVYPFYLLEGRPV